MENRARFALEIIDAVRRAVGDDLVVGMRISGDEFLPGGLDLAQMQETSRLLTAAGRLDYLNVSNSTYSDLGSMTNHIPSMYLPPAAFSHLWAGIKEAVKVPVLGIGRINSPHLAEEILAQGKADLIGMVRELISDPELPNKARDGRADDIRPCIVVQAQHVLFAGEVVLVAARHDDVAAPAIGEHSAQGPADEARSAGDDDPQCSQVCRHAGSVAGVQPDRIEGQLRRRSWPRTIAAR